MTWSRRRFNRNLACAATAGWVGASRAAGQRKTVWSISAERFPRIDYQPGAPEPLRYAAEELATYLRRILGPGKPAPAHGGPAIVLELADDEGLGDDGFELALRGETLTIRGHAAGVVYGAFEFLRRFGGCSFAGEGPDCEYVPRREQIDVDVPVLRMRPKLWYRAYQFFYPEPRELSVQRFDWMVRNGLNFITYNARPDDVPDHFTADDPPSGVPLSQEQISYTVGWFNTNLLPEALKRGLQLDYNIHNLYHWLPPYRYFDQHPEWYALVNGKRVGELGQQLAICTSNEEAVSMLVANVKQFLRANPYVKIVGVIPEDGIGMCQCERCVRGDLDPKDAFRPYLGNKLPAAENKSKSLRNARLVNHVAREVRDEFPHVLVGHAAYVDLEWPPEGLKLEPNVITWFAIYGRDGAHPLAADSPSPTNRFFFDLIRKWRQVHPGHLTVYEYYMGMDAQRSLPYPMAEGICRDWPNLKRIGVEGAIVQSWSSNHNSYGLNNLAFARLGWNDQVDFEGLMDEFLLGMFGRAASELKPVFVRMQQALKSVEAGTAGDSLYLSTYDVSDITKGSFLPDAYNIGYLLEQIGGDFLDGALGRAKQKAADARERRQVEYFAAVTVYWRKSAEALGIELRAMQAHRKGDKPRAAELYRQALVKEQEASDYARTLPPRGWMSVTLPRVWRRSLNELKERLAEVT